MIKKFTQVTFGLDYFPLLDVCYQQLVLALNIYIFTFAVSLNCRSSRRISSLREAIDFTSISLWLRENAKILHSTIILNNPLLFQYVFVSIDTMF